MALFVESEGLRVELGPEGMSWQGSPLLPLPRFRLNGKPAAVASMAPAPGGVVALLVGEGVQGKWHLRTAGDAVASAIEVDGSQTPDSVEIEIPFPLSAAIELPTGQNWGWRLDGSCPPGREAGAPLSGAKNQFVVADLGACALAFVGLADYTRYLPGTYAAVWRQGAFRDERALWLQLNVVGGVPLEVSAHPGIAQAIDHYCAVLRRNLGVRTLAEDPSVPGWLDDLRLTAIFSMWHSNGTILQDFRDLLAFCRDLDSLGVRRGVLIRLVGFQGRFDSHYPFYDPAPALGGAEGLRALSQAAHAGGHRLSAHFNIWGMDPYLEAFEGIEHLAVPFDRCYERIPTGQIGPYDGWPGAYPAVPTGYDSGFLPLTPVEAGPSHLTFETAEIPEPMEAFLTVAGVRGMAEGQLRARVDDRQVKSPAGALAHDDRCRFRFRFRFAPGRNRVQLDFAGGAPALSGLTYRINGSVRGGRLWSYPIVRADLHHPQWAQVTRENLGRVAREFGIDVPYIDAVNIWRQTDRPIFAGLQEALSGKVFACEYSSELGYDMFRMTLVGVGGAPPVASHLPLSDMARRLHERYTRLMYLAQSPDVTSEDAAPTEPFDRFLDEANGQAAQALAEGPRRGVMPAIRLNYRDRTLTARERDFILATVNH